MLLQIRQIHLAVFNNHTKLPEAIPQHKQIAKKKFHIYTGWLTIRGIISELAPYMVTFSFFIWSLILEVDNFSIRFTCISEARCIRRLKDGAFYVVKIARPTMVWVV